MWPTEESAKYYFIIVNLIFQYLFPLSIVGLFYFLILTKVLRRKVPKFGAPLSTNVSNLNQRIIDKSKMKVLKMLIIIVLLFALSWLPLYVIFARIKLGSPFEESSVEGELIVTLTPIAQWLGASNSCLNPLLYFFFNGKFRQYFVKGMEANCYRCLCMTKKLQVKQQKQLIIADFGRSSVTRV